MHVPEIRTTEELNMGSRITRARLIGVLTSILLGILLVGAGGAYAQKPSEEAGGTTHNLTLLLPGTQEAPQAVDAFAFLSPCTLPVTQGQTFTLDLVINAGT